MSYYIIMIQSKNQSTDSLKQDQIKHISLIKLHLYFIKIPIMNVISS